MFEISAPRDLLVETLRDLYSAETLLVGALAKLAKSANSKALRAAFKTHLAQTREHIARLERAGEQLAETMKGPPCAAMEVLVSQGRKIIDRHAGPPLHDLALIAVTQKIEHYEIAGYGTARTLAELAGESDVAEILQQTLDEEGETDELLTMIAIELAPSADADRRLTG